MNKKILSLSLSIFSVVLVGLMAYFLLNKDSSEAPVNYEDSTQLDSTLVKEGQEYASSLDQTAIENKCESGLSPVAAAVPTKSDCAYPAGPYYVCVECGNGICGEGENHCNCRQDCPFVEYVEPKPFVASSVNDCMKLEVGNVSEGSLSSPRDKCINTFVKDHVEIIQKDACDEIRSPNYKRLCQQTLAVRLKDFSLCDRSVLGEKTAQFCIRDSAIELKRVDWCEKITDAVQKSYCQSSAK